MCHQENKYDLICSHPTCKTCQTSESEMQTKQLNGRQAPKLTEWPDVRLGAEFAVSDDLWGWPLDRELGALWARVLIIKNKSRVWRVDTDHKLWLTVTLMLCNNLKNWSSRTYLVIPKSDTFTSLFFETRQFLAAFGRKKGMIKSSNKAGIWKCIVKEHFIYLPDLCGWSWTSLDKPSLRWHPDTSPTIYPETTSLSFLAGSPSGSRFPCTQTRGR